MIELAAVEDDQRSLWIEACVRERWGLGEGWIRESIRSIEGDEAEVAVYFNCAFSGNTANFHMPVEEFLEWLSR